MNKVLNNVLAFCGGILGASILFLIWFFLKNPFPPTPWGRLFNFLILSALIEEGVKFLFIKRDIGQWPYGFILGLGFGIAESVWKHPFVFSLIARTPAIILHTLCGGIIAYYIKKNRPLFGLMLAILLHTLFNTIIGGINKI